MVNTKREYLFQVQPLENLEDQPVEFDGKEGDAKKYPYADRRLGGDPKTGQRDSFKEELFGGPLEIRPGAWFEELAAFGIT